MPTDSYQKDLIKRLETNSEYATLLLETALEEALEDGYMDGFLVIVTLQDVIEATNHRSEEPSDVHLHRQALYQKLITKTPLTKELVISSLKEVGLNFEMKILKAQTIIS